MPNILILPSQIIKKGRLPNQPDSGTSWEKQISALFKRNYSSKNVSQLRQEKKHKPVVGIISFFHRKVLCLAGWLFGLVITFSIIQISKHHSNKSASNAL